MTISETTPPNGQWPSVPVQEWEPTRNTLHRWTQIVGKVRMAYNPPINHWWHTTLYVGSRGLTTSLIPHPSGGFEVLFDFVDHRLLIRHVDGRDRSVPLEPRSVADFYEEFVTRLAELGIDAPIMAQPVEVEDNTPFAEDRHHATYDGEAVHRFWRSLVDAHRVFTGFRSGFSGKTSPVHFFWGAFDLAVTRFSGRQAPRHPGGMVNCPDWVMHEAYSEEVSSAGYWPGGADEGIFYSYAYPGPDGFADYPVKVEGAYWDTDLGEFVLPYKTVRMSSDPDGTLARFLEGTYEAAATTGNWDRSNLDIQTDSAPPWTYQG